MFFQNEPVAGGPSPSEVVQSHEQELIFADVIEQLRPEHREVIVLRHLEELPYEEIAARMQRSPGAVRMLWVRALSEFRRALNRVHPGM